MQLFNFLTSLHDLSFQQADGTSESSESTKKLFVGGVKEGDTEEDVRNLFSNEGIVEKVEMVTDKQTGKLKPFCFITFEDTDVTDKCVCKSAVDVVVNLLASHQSL